jgi:hypothetical protein
VTSIADRLAQRPDPPLSIGLGPSAVYEPFTRLPPWLVARARIRREIRYFLDITTRTDLI